MGKPPCPLWGISQRLSGSRQQEIGVRALARGAAAAASGRAGQAEQEAHRAHLGRPLQRERPPETARPNIAEAEHRPLPRRKRNSGVAEAEHRRGRTSPFAAHEEELEHRRGAAMRVARAAAVLRDEHELEQLEARIDHNVVVDLEVDATCRPEQTGARQQLVVALEPCGPSVGALIIFAIESSSPVCTSRARTGSSREINRCERLSNSS